MRMLDLLRALDVDIIELVFIGIVALLALALVIGVALDFWQVYSYGRFLEHAK